MSKDVTYARTQFAECGPTGTVDNRAADIQRKLQSAVDKVLAEAGIPNKDAGSCVAVEGVGGDFFGYFRLFVDVTAGPSRPPKPPEDLIDRLEAEVQRLREENIAFRKSHEQADPAAAMVENFEQEVRRSKTCLRDLRSGGR